MYSSRISSTFFSASAMMVFFSGGITELYRAWMTGTLVETPEEIANTANEILENSSLFFKRTDSASNK